MEDSPKFTNPESEIAQDFNLYVEVLNTSSNEKELLKSIIRNKLEGKLTITIDKGVSKEVIIDSLQDEEYLIEQISEALDEMSFYTMDKNVVNAPQERLTITFSGISPSYIPSTLQ